MLDHMTALNIGLHPLIIGNITYSEYIYLHIYYKYIFIRTHSATLSLLALKLFINILGMNMQVSEISLNNRIVGGKPKFIHED